MEFSRAEEKKKHAGIEKRQKRQQCQEQRIIHVGYFSDIVNRQASLYTFLHVV